MKKYLNNHNKNLLVDVRDIEGVDAKYHRDFIWIVWSIILYFSNDNNKNFSYRKTV